VGKLLQHIKALFRREPREYIYEPVTHRLNPHPILPQGMMEAIALVYEEMLQKEKRLPRSRRNEFFHSGVSATHLPSPISEDVSKHWRQLAILILI